MNVRTQVTLDPEIQRRAHKKAAELGISFAEYVRRVVATDLGGAKRKADLSSLFDLGASDAATDIARDKDKIVGQAFWDEHIGKTEPKARRSRRTTTA